MIAAYSHSALKIFRDCPRKFKFQYLEKPDIPKRVGAETYLGNAVHRVLQLLYTRGNDGVEISLESALQKYHDEWRKVDKTQIEVAAEFMGVDDYIRVGAEMLAKHHAKYRPFKHGTLLGAEMWLSYTIPNTPFKLRAVIDRLWRRDDGIVEICDYKTGRHLPKPKDPDFYYQMGLYQLAVMQSYPQYQNIEVAQYFLRMSEEVRCRMTPDDLDQLTEDLRQAVLAIHHAQKLDAFPTVETPLCAYCDFYRLCPAKRHQQMIEECPDDPKAPYQQAYKKATEYIQKHTLKKALEAELDALKADLGRLADEMDINKFAGDGGEVSLTTKREEKFITRTDNPSEFAELSALARQFGLDDYFKLDGAILMKEAYLKKRLDPQAMEALAKFIQCKESTTVRVKLSKPEDDEVL